MSDSIPLNPHTTPLGVALIAGSGTARALEIVRDLESPAVIEQAIAAERRCQGRSAVIAALQTHLAARRALDKPRRKAQRRRAP